MADGNRQGLCEPVYFVCGDFLNGTLLLIIFRQVLNLLDVKDSVSLDVRAQIRLLGIFRGGRRYCFGVIRIVCAELYNTESFL